MRSKSGLLVAIAISLIGLVPCGAMAEGIRACNEFISRTVLRNVYYNSNSGKRESGDSFCAKYSSGPIVDSTAATICGASSERIEWDKVNLITTESIPQGALDSYNKCLQAVSSRDLSVSDVTMKFQPGIWGADDGRGASFPHYMLSFRFTWYAALDQVTRTDGSTMYFTAPGHDRKFITCKVLPQKPRDPHHGFNDVWNGRGFQILSLISYSFTCDVVKSYEDNELTVLIDHYGNNGFSIYFPKRCEMSDGRDMEGCVQTK